MTKSRGILRPRHKWAGFELDALQRLFPDTKTSALAETLGIPASFVTSKAKALGLKKSAAFLSGPHSGRLDGVRGTETRFKPGNVPPNLGRKGVRMSPRTEFKKGGRAVNTLEVGALRINSLGDLDIKLAEGPRQWLCLRRYVWETEVGPVPEGMCVVARNGDGHDTQLSNLMLLTRAENIARNLHLKYPKDLRSAMQLQGRIKNRIKALEVPEHA